MVFPAVFIGATHRVVWLWFVFACSRRENATAFYIHSGSASHSNDCAADSHCYTRRRYNDA